MIQGTYMYTIHVAICVERPLHLTLLHSEWSKLNGVLAILSAIGFLNHKILSIYRNSCILVIKLTEIFFSSQLTSKHNFMATSHIYIYIPQSSIHHIYLAICQVFSLSRMTTSTMKFCFNMGYSLSKQFQRFRSIIYDGSGVL